MLLREQFGIDAALKESELKKRYALRADIAAQESSDRNFRKLWKYSYGLLSAAAHVQELEYIYPKATSSGARPLKIQPSGEHIFPALYLAIAIVLSVLRRLDLLHHLGIGNRIHDLDRKRFRLLSEQMQPRAAKNDASLGRFVIE